MQISEGVIRLSPRPTSRPAVQRPAVHSTARGPAARGPLHGPWPSGPRSTPRPVTQRPTVQSTARGPFFWSAVYISACLVVDPHRQRKMNTGEFPWSFRFLSKSFQSFAIHLILCFILLKGQHLIKPLYVFLLQNPIVQRTFVLKGCKFGCSHLSLSLWSF